MKAALLQLTSGDDPLKNLPVTLGYVTRAAQAGAKFVLTPEVTNCVSASRARQREVLQAEDDDITLAALRATAKDYGIWVLIGSLALKTNDTDGRFANRSFLISPDGAIVARYDKIHMFDVAVSDSETYRESAGYRPGTHSVVAPMPFGLLGMTICYDVRFPHLYRQLAQAGATAITVPSAFSPVTGAAHWKTLLRARAIETGAYVLAPAQTGQHPTSRGKQRATHGHTLVVNPWGEILADAGSQPGIITIDVNPDEVAKARQRIPAMCDMTRFDGP